MADHDAVALVAALVLAGVHVAGGRLRFLEGIPRSAWLSAFAGVSVAYVFVHLLPTLAEGRETVEHVFLVALLGVAVFYGVESHSLRSRAARRAATGEDRTGGGAFWLSIASFAAYNAIVGYLLLRGELEDAAAIALYTFALAVHFVINDFGLREHHRDAYDRIGRWVISAAVLAGWLVGAATTIPEGTIVLVLAFVAGGVVLNVMKEELPGDRQARFVPFAAGAALYALLLEIA